MLFAAASSIRQTGQVTVNQLVDLKLTEVTLLSDQIEKGAKMVQVGWNLYLTGGIQNQNKVVQLVLGPDLQVVESLTMVSMNHSRISHSICVQNDKYLIVSGSWKEDALATVEY